MIVSHLDLYLRAMADVGASTRQFEARTALEGGAEAILTKPIDFGMLRSEIDMRIERAA